MRRIRTVIAATAILTVVAAGGGTAQAAGRCGGHPWCDTSLSADARAQLLLGALTRDEKISLLAGDELCPSAGAGARTRTGR
jgi:beta-glucosidase